MSAARPTLARNSAGFTLIELMIVVVIVAVLIAIALPAYQSSIIKSNRRAAQSDLITASQAMEKDYAVKFTYATAAAGTTFPAVSPANATGNKVKYNLTIASSDATNYVLRATPVANGTQDGDGYLEIDNLGRKSWDKNNDADTADTLEDSWEQ